ncbi:Plasmodium variant antigen protein Cir/Yir/Bir, putative, partial [Plasmodium chabaudi adami]
MIWLIYTLKLKSDDKVMEFYNKCINVGEDYISSIKDTSAYNIYKNLMDNKLFLMNAGIKDISIFYDALKSLCKMYNEFDDDDSRCTENLYYAKKFAEKYEILLNNNDTDTEDSLYSQILSILSTDYDNFVKKCYEKKEGCNIFPSLTVSFWLFVKNFGDGSSFTKNVDSNTNIFHYIMIWLIYTLKLKSDDKVMEFYNKCINVGEDYISSIKDTSAYNIYKNLMDNKLFLMNAGIKDISIFYDALKSLCKMYNEFDDDDSRCTENLYYAKKFAEKYEILLNNNDTDTEDSLYSQILSILSTDYDNFVKKCYEKK